MLLHVCFRRVVEPRSRRVVLANLLKCAAMQQTAWRSYEDWVKQNKRFFITQEEKINKMFHLRIAEPRGLRKVRQNNDRRMFAH